MSPKTAKLIIAASETDSNLYYATRFLVPDPVIFFEMGGKKHLILSDLELDRARLQAKVHHVLSLAAIGKHLRPKKKHPHLPVTALVVDSVFGERGIKKVIVPANLPALYFDALKKLGYQMEIKPDPFFESRLIKTAEEKKYITRAIRQTERALAETLVILEKSRIRRNRIYYGREMVTSEMLRESINSKLMERGCIASSTIVSSGVQGSYPHHEGSGPIIPHTPIIFDIFPRDRETRYWGDMTRTVVKGRPSDEVKKMFRAVMEANRRATEKIKSGMHSSKLHQTAVQCLEALGFKTGKINGRMQGFIHSTGHGVGLDVHEPPSVSLKGQVLKAGNVITIEPGLYYEKHGGIRLEDTLYVTRSGSESLTRFPKFLEIDKV